MKAYLTNSNTSLNIDIVPPSDLSKLDKYNFVILDAKLDNSTKVKIVNHFKLTTSVKKFVNKDRTIYIISSIDAYKSTINKKDGIQESEDIIRYKDLEIEKTCRVAYELAKDSLLVLDSSNKLLSSKLFRKIASDINQDYINIFRQDAYIDDLNYYLDKPYDFILTEQLHESILVNSLLYKNFILEEHYLTNDIQKNFYISYTQKMLEDLMKKA